MTRLILVLGWVPIPDPASLMPQRTGVKPPQLSHKALTDWMLLPKSHFACDHSPASQEREEGVVVDTEEERSK